MLLAIIVIAVGIYGLFLAFSSLASDCRDDYKSQLHDFGCKEDFSERIEEDPYSLFRNTMK